jgi:hypothetical protein
MILLEHYNFSTPMKLFTEIFLAITCCLREILEQNSQILEWQGSILIQLFSPTPCVLEQMFSYMPPEAVQDQPVYTKKIDS